MSEPFFSIIIPTYNREKIIKSTVQSVINQTFKKWELLIIDDGSTDDTKILVQSRIKENKIEINYYYQKNQGMHGAHNASYKLIDTVLNTCIDSDDFMPDNAIEKILDNWKTIENNKKFAGLVGLDSDKDGKIIGSKMPNDLNETTLTDIYEKHHVIGDKKLVLRTLISEKTHLSQYLYTDDFDSNGNPTNFLFQNTYSFDYIKNIVKNFDPKINLEFIQDEFDSNVLQKERESRIYHERGNQHQIQLKKDPRKRKPFVPSSPPDRKNRSNLSIGNIESSVNSIDSPQVRRPFIVSSP